MAFFDLDKTKKTLAFSQICPPNCHYYMSTQNEAKRAPPFATDRWRHCGRQNGKVEKQEILKILKMKNLIPLEPQKIEQF